MADHGEVFIPDRINHGLGKVDSSRVSSSSIGKCEIR